MYLIDTDILSALRRRNRSPEIVKWISTQRMADLYLSVVSVGEIERGIARQRNENPAIASTLATWLDDVIGLYGERILGVDMPTARRWGQLSAALKHDSADLLIAATALERGLTVVTRNVRHFLPTGVLVIDPSSPDAATKTPYEIYRELDLGQGGYAVAPARDAKAAVAKVIAAKHRK